MKKMNKCVSRFFFLVSIVTGILVSCGSPTGPGVTQINNEKPSSYEWMKWQFYSPVASSETVFFDDFEGDSITSNNSWSTVNASQTSYAEIRSSVAVENPAWAASLFPGKESKLVSLSGDSRTTSYIKYDNLHITEECYLTFRYFLCLVPSADFKVVINNDYENPLFSEAGVNTNLFSTVKVNSLIIPAGTTSITFIVTNTSDSHYTNVPNSAYVDDISLVYNRIAKINLTPKSNQKTYVGAPANERIPVKAYALRADGTLIEDANINLSATNGTVSNGYFIPSSSGTAKITATCNGCFAESGDIEVLANNSAKGPCTIAGVTYFGVQSDSGTTLSGNYVDMELEYPKTDTVTADGFVRVKGKLLTDRVEGGKKLSRVVIAVTNGEEQTIYVCDKEFDIRVWLPFSGENTITVGGAYVLTNQYIDSNGNTCEGDIKAYSWFTDYTFKATDGHIHTQESSGSTDGRYVYLSYYSQTDDFLVQNTTNEVLSTLPQNASDEEKFKAIHDYIVTHCYYDYSSISSGNTRKKQDAVSVLKNGTAVCAGYTCLTSAMARYAGIPARYISSPKLNHAWNHVEIKGNRAQKEWLFCDTTWDDPDKDPDSNRIFYNYFLLTDFNGVQNDHEDENQRIVGGRAAVSEAIIDIEEPELPVLIKDGFWF